MLHHIKKLHAHPEHVRERIAIGVAAALTFFVLVAWVMTLDTRLAALDFSVSENKAAARESLNGLVVANEREVEPGSPADILKRKLGETYGNLREAVGY